MDTTIVNPYRMAITGNEWQQCKAIVEARFHG